VRSGRRDIHDPPAARPAKAPPVDVEAAGFAEATIRTAVGDREDGGVGPHRFTVRVRVRDRGYVVRIIAGDAGVLLTADDVGFEAFDDAAAAVAAVGRAR
jgi:hypothetical protein